VDLYNKVIFAAKINVYLNQGVVEENILKLVYA